MLTKTERETIKNRELLSVGHMYSVRVTEAGQIMYSALDQNESPEARRMRLVNNWEANNPDVEGYGVTSIETMPGVWDVTSGSGSAVYTVWINQEGLRKEVLCTCPHGDHNTGDCNHTARVWMATQDLTEGEHYIQEIFRNMDARWMLRLDRIERMRADSRRRHGDAAQVEAQNDLDEAGA